MSKRIGESLTAAAISAAILLAGCATQPPSEPTVMALPAPGKCLESFQADSRGCRAYAGQRVTSRSVGHLGSNPAATGAGIGTAGGAVSGAPLGAIGRNAGAGTAIGAAAGRLGRASIGSSEVAMDQYSLQHIYDTAYTQPMFAHGDTLNQTGSAYRYSYFYPDLSPPLALAGSPFCAPGIIVSERRQFHRFHHFDHFHGFDHFRHFGQFRRFGGFRHR